MGGHRKDDEKLMAMHNAFSLGVVTAGLARWSSE